MIILSAPHTTKLAYATGMGKVLVAANNWSTYSPATRRLEAGRLVVRRENLAYPAAETGSSAGPARRPLCRCFFLTAGCCLPPGGTTLKNQILTLGGDGHNIFTAKPILLGRR
ncbi:hypothetical protein BG74_04790 [Sodalis-like endosymbiont of Proechinophthirus fluctus]|nr:hypothetical protein BG74_04790 [Sodalis-like endosymbiont of Proechinophthirus fluctus]